MKLHNKYDYILLHNEIFWKFVAQLLSLQIKQRWRDTTKIPKICFGGIILLGVICLQKYLIKGQIRLYAKFHGPS